MYDEIYMWSIILSYHKSRFRIHMDKVTAKILKQNGFVELYDVSTLIFHI